MDTRIGIIGLGYVGLPVALAFARKFKDTVGFDINARKIENLKKGLDVTGEVETADLKATSMLFSSSIEDLRSCNFFIAAVPTPIDASKRPDLTLVVKATESIGKVLKKGDIVVYESTVYPGVTEEICGPILERVSGLKRGEFKLGYSPERINPGDKEHTLERVIKVVAGEDAATLERVAQTYSRVVDAGVYKATSIRVAEAAKVIENTQRDLNIALMNELSVIFDRMNIRTKDVLAAAGTKWNFLKFFPGLVGGHCIGVDPYYLTAKAEELGYSPEVILAGRRINDSMGTHIAQRTVKLLAQRGTNIAKARVGVAGITFKEDVPDTRNSRVPDIVAELKQYGIDPLIFDPIADAEEVDHEYGLKLTATSEVTDLDALIVAVAHKEFAKILRTDMLKKLKKGGVFIDVKSLTSPAELGPDYTYWSL